MSEIESEKQDLSKDLEKALQLQKQLYSEIEQLQKKNLTKV